MHPRFPSYSPMATLVQLEPCLVMHLYLVLHITLAITQKSMHFSYIICTLKPRKLHVLASQLPKSCLTWVTLIRSHILGGNPQLSYPHFPKSTASSQQCFVIMQECLWKVSSNSVSSYWIESCFPMNIEKVNWSFLMCPLGQGCYNCILWFYVWWLMDKVSHWSHISNNYGVCV